MHLTGDSWKSGRYFSYILYNMFSFFFIQMLNRYLENISKSKVFVNEYGKLECQIYFCLFCFCFFVCLFVCFLVFVYFCFVFFVGVVGVYFSFLVFYDWKKVRILMDRVGTRFLGRNSHVNVNNFEKFSTHSASGRRENKRKRGDKSDMSLVITSSPQTSKNTFCIKKKKTP